MAATSAVIRPAFRLAALAILAWVAVALVTSGAFPNGRHAPTSVLILASLVIPIWCCIRRNGDRGASTIDLLQPGIVLATFSYFYFVVPALHIWLDLDYQSSWLDPTWPPARLFQVTLLLCLMGLVAFTIGYRFNVPWARVRPASQQADPWPQAATTVALTMLIVGFPFRVLHLLTLGGLSQNALLFLSPSYQVEAGVKIGGITTLCEYLFDWGALLLALRAVMTNRQRFLSLLIWCTAFLLAYLETGKRSAILPFLMFPVVWVHYLKRRLNLLRALSYSGLAFVLVTVMLFMRAIGPLFATSGITFTAVPEEIASAPTRFYLNSPELAVFDMTMLAVQDRRALLHEIGGPFRGGLQFNLAPATYIVPRALWPGKPTFSDLGQVFYQHAVGGQENVGFSIGIISGLYIFGGVLGVLVGMVVVGVLFRLVYQWLRPWDRDPGRVLLYSIALWMGFQFVRFGTLGFTIMFLYQFELPGVLVGWLLLRMGKRPRPDAQLTPVAAPSA